jgi:capsular polysaccharide transport system permease protein
METERYESQAIVLLKDLSSKQKMNLSELLMGQSSSTMQDSKVLELYIRSSEMLKTIDKDFNLTNYYLSDELDFAQRLYAHSIFPAYQINQINLLKKYNNDLQVIYDDPSGTIKLSFIHIKPETAQKILKLILMQAETIVNSFAKENAQIALNFIKKQRKEKRQAFIEAIKKLIDYQNRHHTIDPSLDVERKITILTELETELVKSEVEYATKLKTYNPNSREVQMLKENIRNIRNSIARVKRSLSGSNKNGELNTNVFDFQLLKSDMEFAKEVYRQTLINQEELKAEVAQKSKHLIIVAKPTLPDDYRYPDRLWDTMIVLLVLWALYGIIIAIVNIIESHKD